jgi:hypothetical protein
VRGRGLSKVGVVGVVASIALLVSALLGGIASGAPGDPPSPTVTGDPEVGSTLTADLGDVFRWQRCDPDVFECGPGIDDAGWTDITGAGGQDRNTYVVAAADAGHLIRVLAKGAPIGTKFVASNSVGPVPEPPEPPADDPISGGTTEEDPIFGSTGNVEPIRGVVTIQLPNGEILEITRVTQIPVGSIVDVSNGHAILTTQKKPGGPLQSTEEWGAPFEFDQKENGSITKLTLVHSLHGSDRVASERRGHRRGLWGRGRCRCRTSGQNSSGTARGTFYLVKETDKGTFTKVKHGKVLVKNLNTGKKVLLKKGEHYLARDKHRRN